ncbi:hypothetical protein [Kineococcus arenarius]|uniref:hypothetical protein n=1 Tax=Kineococcus sp. SYSU DK007 TaxID=3383128 RepID=UPI003D7E28AD
MSWNGADLFATGGLESLPPGFSAAAGTSPVFEGFPVAAAVRDGLLHVHFTAAALEQVPESLAASTGAERALAVLHSGTTDTYVLEAADAGHTSRLLVISEGGVVVDEGAPSPYEAAPRRDPEEWLFGLVEELTGTSVPALPGVAETWTELRRG